MKAIRIHEYGGPEVMHYEDIAAPEPGQGQVRVKVEAAGVNFIDIYHRTGLYGGQLPLTLGVEAAGIVDAIGPDVTGVKPGDRIAYPLQQGTYAEYAVVPASQLVPVPSGVSALQAAALMVQGLTAHYLTHNTYPLKPGDTALVHAAAGGTGALLVQMAKRRGARVIGTCSTEEKEKLAREAGADEVIRYSKVDFEPEVRRLTGGKGVDVVYDSVGKDTFERSLNCLRPRGYMVLFGQSSGPVAPFNPQVLAAKGSLFLTRPMIGAHIADRKELLSRAADVFGWVARGELAVRIDRTFTLAQAADAHHYVSERGTRGKLVLIP